MGEQQKQDVEEQEEEQRQRSSTATASDESWETDMEIPTSPPKSDFEVVVDEKESAITQDSDEDVKIIDTDISAVASKNTVDGNVTDENELLESTNDAVGSIIDGNIVSEVVQDEIPLDDDDDDILTKEEEDILIKDNRNNNDNNNELDDKNDAIAVEQNEDEDTLIEEDDVFDTIEQGERHAKDHIDTHIIKSEQQQQQQQQQQEPTVD